MGSCQCSNQSQEVVFIITSSEDQIPLSKRARLNQLKKNTGSKTSFLSQIEKIENINTQTVITKLDVSQKNHFTDSIGDEMLPSESNSPPPFILQKYIPEPLFIRNNRFIDDIEQEVKQKIKDLQYEEQQQKINTSVDFQASSVCSDEGSVKKEKQQFFKKALKQTPSINDALPSDNSNMQNNPFQIAKSIKQSQFAPQKSENSNRSKQSQFGAQKSENNSNPQRTLTQRSVSNTQKSLKSQLSKKTGIIYNQIVELNSNMASKGSSGDNSQPKYNAQFQKAFEKIFTDLISGDPSMLEKHNSQDTKPKSILKSNSMNRVGMDLSRSVSNRSNYTNRSQRLQKKKCVRFTQDTNFNYERKYPKFRIEDVHQYEVYW